MEKNKRNPKIKLSANAVAFLAAITIVVGLFFASYNFVHEKQMAVYDYVNEEINQVATVADETTQEIEEEQVQNEAQEAVDLDHYIGYLEIPKLNFNRGFYDISSSQNTVESNIQVIEGSSMPNVSNGNLIIAGHSGTGYRAFFNDLYKLELGDTAIVTYKERKYTYQITNIYTQAKTGTVTIKRNKNKTILTLITCTNNDDTTQTIYIAELVSVE